MALKKKPQLCCWYPLIVGARYKRNKQKKYEKNKPLSWDFPPESGDFINIKNLLETVT